MHLASPRDASHQCCPRNLEEAHVDLPQARSICSFSHLTLVKFTRLGHQLSIPQIAITENRSVLKRQSADRKFCHRFHTESQKIVEKIAVFLERNFEITVFLHFQITAFSECSGLNRLWQETTNKSRLRASKDQLDSRNID